MTRVVNVETVTFLACSFCDGTTYHFPYGRDESCHCTNCGAEWTPVPVTEEVEVLTQDRCDQCGTSIDLSLDGVCKDCKENALRDLAAKYLEQEKAQLTEEKKALLKKIYLAGGVAYTDYSYEATEEENEYSYYAFPASEYSTLESFIDAVQRVFNEIAAL